MGLSSKVGYKVGFESFEFEEVIGSRNPVKLDSIGVVTPYGGIDASREASYDKGPTPDGKTFRDYGSGDQSIDIPVLINSAVKPKRAHKPIKKF